MIFGRTSSSTYFYGSVKILDSNGNSLWNYSISSGTWYNGTITMPSGAKRIVYNGQHNTAFVEISIDDAPSIVNHNSTYPVITKNGVVLPTGDISINYFTSSVQRLYKINNGEWQNYQNKNIKLNYGDTVYAKGINIIGRDTKNTNYKISIPGDAIPSYIYDGNTGGSYTTSTVYVSVDSSAIGKGLCAQANRMSIYKAKNTFRALDKNNNVLASRTVDTIGISSSLFTIPENTARIQYYQSDGRLYELRVCN